jgi:hypothetical protein
VGLPRRTGFEDFRHNRLYAGKTPFAGRPARQLARRFSSDVVTPAPGLLLNSSGARPGCLSRSGTRRVSVEAVYRSIVPASGATRSRGREGEANLGRLELDPGGREEATFQPPKLDAKTPKAIQACGPTREADPTAEPSPVSRDFTANGAAPESNRPSVGCYAAPV